MLHYQELVNDKNNLLRFLTMIWYIFPSREIPGNEKKIISELKNQLLKKKLG